MASIPAGSEVTIVSSALGRMTFGPPGEATLVVAVHEAALRAPGSPHTQLLGFSAGEVVWAGALGETLLDVLSDSGGDPRMLLADCLGVGERLWHVVWPGDLVTNPAHGPLSTVYWGARPWLVVGTLPSGDPLAAPLNDATNPRWFTPVVPAADLDFPGSFKDAQVELAHLWSLPASVGTIGSLRVAAREGVVGVVRGYF